MGATKRATLRGLYILGAASFARIYGPDEQRDIAALVNIYAPPQTPETVRDNPGLLADADVIFSGWGGPRLDPAFLDAAPRLQAFFYGAGATGGLIHPLAWERGVQVTSAAAANAIPVAEYTVASIIFALKQGFRLQRQAREAGAYPSRAEIKGIYGATVGLISLGAIGQAVCERLRGLDITIIAHDPYLSDAAASVLGVERVGLGDLFRRADVVSLHTPWLPETERMIQSVHFAAMRPYATFINTARGAVVAEDEMVAVLADRPDLTAILDVTHPEPPPPGSPLYTLPNVFLTPHIAGSLGDECYRMGRYMVEELERFCRGEALRWAVRPETAAHTSHRVAG